MQMFMWILRKVINHKIILTLLVEQQTTIANIDYKIELNWQTQKYGNNKYQSILTIVKK